MKEIKILKKMGVCEEAIKWLKTQENYKQAWQNCKRGDWMLWLIRETSNNEQELRRLTLIKARYAKLVLHLMRDEHSKKAVQIEELDKAAAAIVREFYPDPPSHRSLTASLSKICSEIDHLAHGETKNPRKPNKTSRVFLF